MHKSRSSRNIERRGLAPPEESDGTIPGLLVRSAKDEEIPLFASALLIARDEYPELDDADYEARLAEFTRSLRELLVQRDSARPRNCAG